MTLVYMDGFDAHILAPIEWLDVGAGTMQDAGIYWTGGTNQFYAFTNGYQEGRAFNVGAASQQYAGCHRNGGPASRVGFWARGNGNDRPFNLVSIGPYHVHLDTGRAVHLIDGTGNTIWQSVGGQFSSDWAHYEFYADRNGHLEFRKDGILLASVDGQPTPDMTLGVSVGTRQLGSSPGNTYDHLYITDGAPLEGSGVLGVQVVAGVDLYDSNDWLQGTLIINGSRYNTDVGSGVVNTKGAYAGGRNLCNFVNYLFPRNPDTGQPWSTTTFNEIDQWGLCYVARGEPTELRVTQIHLAWLESAPRGPIIRTRQVGGTTSFSGTWRRTNETMSLSQHVYPMPRRNNSVFRDDVDAIFPSSNGCILFTGPEEVPEDPEFTGVGLTFAEEFREDYRDWVRVDTKGLPFESYFISGYSVLGEGNRKFQDNYVTVNYENVPTGGAYIQGVWDYAETSETGRWSNRQVIDNKGGDYKHAHRRIKIRGHGKALSIRITNKGDYPFIVNGWTALVTSNTST